MGARSPNPGSWGPYTEDAALEADAPHQWPQRLLGPSLGVPRPGDLGPCSFLPPTPKERCRGWAGRPTGPWGAPGPCLVAHQGEGLLAFPARQREVLVRHLGTTPTLSSGSVRSLLCGCPALVWRPPRGQLLITVLCHTAAVFSSLPRSVAATQVLMSKQPVAAWLLG